ncbi:MAG TPA: tetratricopeptide repeat protein, partial [Verrucomicrobiae bacterium]|nr:tetratricopeptide repeat protein [Verrucomicrobiae bacterium]
DDVSTRPWTAPPDFDWNSIYGRFLQGKENERQRDYTKAEEAFQSCLSSDTNFAPALVEAAALANRRADYTRALEYSRRALSIDTYDPAGNYQFALASAALGHHTDARDGFSIAALSIEKRSGATTELAKEFLREREYERALSSAEESLRYNSLNVEALELQAVSSRLLNRKTEAAKILKRLLEIDPLNHFARIEKYLAGRGSRDEVGSLIRSELPQETYLELAVWYHGIERDGDAAKVLELAPPTAEVLYWQAYLRREPGLLARAEAASCEFAFPFRRESIPVFEWADQQRPSWQPKYFLALIRWSQGELEQAKGLLTACGNLPRFAPFYAARAQLTGDVADLETASRMDPGQWRYSAMLIREQLTRGKPSAASALAGEAAARFPENGVITVLEVKTLVATKDYRTAAMVLEQLNLLPCEGSTEAHALFRETHLALSAAHLRAGDYTAALAQLRIARQWPERLGSGKPYPEDLDERLDDWLENRCLVKLGRNDEASAALERVLASASNSRAKGVGTIAEALALDRSNRHAEASDILERWAREQPASGLPEWGLGLVSGRNAGEPGGRQSVELDCLAASLQ